jgi:nitronate monooxygenase
MTGMLLDRLPAPVIQAPMAGGPSTPALAAAVSNAGGLGFVAAGGRTPDAMADDVAATRALTGAPVGVGVFAVPGTPADPAAFAPYLAELEAESRAAGIALGEPRFDDDDLDAKVAALAADPVAVVSFTFGLPAPDTIAALQQAGSEVWITVTSTDEARQAAAAGADALIVQGVEAGGHRGSFVDEDPTGKDLGVIALLQLVRAEVDVPLVAAGGVTTGPALAAVLAAGARAAQIGTAFMLTPEAGTSEVHRTALADDAPTGLTRAFTGRLARGVVNRFQAEHSATAPRAYPEIHHATAALRGHARQSGDGDRLHLFAGQAHQLAQPLPAAQVVEQLVSGASAALEEARRLL